MAISPNIRGGGSYKIPTGKSESGWDFAPAKVAQAKTEGGRAVSTETSSKNTVRGGPVLFWFVAGIAVIKDIIDIFSSILNLVGVGLSATVIGAPVGMALAVFSQIIDFFAGLFIDLTLVAYFGYIGGGFGLRLVIMSIGGFIDAIPFLNILPMTTISFFAAYLFGRAAKKVVSSVGLNKIGVFVKKVAKFV